MLTCLCILLIGHGRTPRLKAGWAIDETHTGVYGILRLMRTVTVKTDKGIMKGDMLEVYNKREGGSCQT